MKRCRRASQGQLIALLSVAASIGLLLVAAAGASASGFKFKETFGSAGQPTFVKPVALAVDQASGDLLVVDVEASTISRFNPDGTPDDFSALGTNVIDGKTGADDTPQHGLSFESNPKSLQLAIDNSGGPTDGDIYVTQINEHLVDIFAQDGSYIGQLTESSEGPFGFTVGVAVDSAGGVYVSELNNGSGVINKFVPAANPPVNGDNTANFARPSFGRLAAGASLTAGFIFASNFGGHLVKLDNTTGVEQYEVTPEESITITVDPASGDLFNVTGSQVKEFDASSPTEAKPLGSFKPSGGATGIAVEGASGNVYVTRSGSSTIDVWERVTVPEAVTEAANPVGATSATLNGAVNPNGLPLTECFFEWGKTQSYGEIAPCEDPDALEVGEGTAPVPVHAEISELETGTTYHFQLVVANANNALGEDIKGGDEQFRTLGPAILNEAASQITASAAKISAQIDPNGEDTSFFVEYLDEASYLANPVSERFTGATKVPVPARKAPASVSGVGGLKEGSSVVSDLTTTAGAFGSGQEISAPGIPAGTTILSVPSPTELELSKPATATAKAVALTATGPQPVIQQLSGLLPQTTYHFRLVASNLAGTALGPDKAFSTFALPGAQLPDGRAYEMVSPPQKVGEVIPPDPAAQVSQVCFECLPGLNKPTMPMQSSPDGQTVLYEGQPFSGGLAAGPNEYLAGRGTSEWGTQSLSEPITTGVYDAFSADLSRSVLFQVQPALSPEAPTRGGKAFANLYLREADGSLQPLLTGEPPNRDPGFAASGGNQFQIRYAGANSGALSSAPFGHLIFEANDALTAAVPGIAPKAPAVEAGEQCTRSGAANCNLYEWTGDQLRLVNVLPGNENAAANAVIGAGRMLSEATDLEAPNADHAISEDGSRIFWSAEGSGQVYVRVNGEETLEIPGPGTCKNSVSLGERACFLSAAADGSVVLLSDGEIFELNEEEDAYELGFDLTLDESEVHKGGFQGILGAGEDLSRVYFVDSEALTGEGEENANEEHAEAGAFNLYAWNSGTTKFVAALNQQDNHLALSGRYGSWKATPQNRIAQVSEDGRTLAFMSVASIVPGTDNRLSSGGQCSVGSACFEVYEYAANSETLTCASCNPSGARPLGPSNLSLLRPGARESGFPPYPQPGNLTSDGSGRLFFESQDALSPQDTNGAVQDVYEWEPNGVGSCERAGGCVSLISSGHDPNASLFLDSSDSGNDAFFITRERLLARDNDSQLDLYDARIGGGFEEIATAPCGGDACKGPASAPPSQQSATSQEFSGPGNEKHKHKKHHKKHKHKKHKHNRGGSR